MTDEINIVLSSNERYMPGATVALASVAVNARPETQLHFHVFTADVERETFAFLEQTILRLHPASVVEEHVCDESILVGLPEYSGSRMAWVRCYYSQLLPNVDWALYLDCDVLYLASPEEHFSYADEDVYACVVRDMSPNSSAGDIPWAKKECGIDIVSEQYFNSGVMLFNFKKWREDGIPKKISEFIGKHPDAYYADQTAMNVIFNGHGLKFIPCKFNYLQTYLDDSALAQRPVIHYVNGIPWLKKISTVANGRYKLWHAFADKYIWHKRGESEKRLFPASHRLIIRLEAMALKCAFLEPLFHVALVLLGKQKCYSNWKWSQVGHDIRDIAV